MSDEIEFVNGLSVKARSEKAPDYVIANGSINCEQMAEWLKGRTGYINWQAKLSKGGKPYVSVDNWKPKDKDEPQRGGGHGKSAPEPAGEFAEDDIPFATNRGMY